LREDDGYSLQTQPTIDLLSVALDAQSARLKRKPMDVAAILGLLRIVAPKFVAAWLAAA
jgi:hypothetical protein